MPIPLNKHAKIWIHPDGIIPDKIYHRLLFQREVRPNDELTFFISKKCLENANDKIKKLTEKGIKIKIIEDCLTTSIDDPYLVTLIQHILEKLTKTKDVKDSVFASDFLRLTNVVQNEGIYSDTDVLFLNNDNSPVISTTYLLGHHNSDAIDIHIASIDKFIRKSFHNALVVKLKNYYGNTPPDHDDKRLVMMPGIHFFPLPTLGHGHLDFEETKDNVLSGLDQTHSGGEKKLHDNTIEDELLKHAQKTVEEINLAKKFSDMHINRK